MSVHIVISAVMLKRMRWYGGGVEPEPVTYPIINAACLRSCLAIEGKEKGRNHANSGTGSIRVGSMGQRDRSVRRAEPHAGATATADAAR